jgi:tRNA nucleotidyltransferase (CCA-adding enzyme)
MEIVLAHNNMDFDALAAQFGVTKLHPGARMIPGHPLSSQIRSFLAVYREALPLAELSYLDLEKVSHVYIVDTQSAERLDDLSRQLIFQRRVPYSIFDHHQIDPEGLGSGADDGSIIKPAGAATTILVDELRRRQMLLSSFEATLFAIGIYEDTGCLTYRGTSETDALCVAYLLAHGADLSQVTNFINPKLTDAQAELLQRLVKNSRDIDVHSAKIVVSHAHCPSYLEGLATLTRRLLELGSAHAAVTVVRMRDRVHIVGRSDSALVDVRALVREFGGDGHVGAASAVSKDDVSEILEKVENHLRLKTGSEVTANEMLVSPVRTILPTITMDEAYRLMLRYGEGGLIVTENDRVSGVVSRRDVDKALHHKLGHAPVRGFMSKPVVTISGATTLSEIQRLMVKEDIGRLPVLNDAGRLLGLVTRRELLRTLYGVTRDDRNDGEDRAGTAGDGKKVSLADKLGMLDESGQWLVAELGRIAASRGMSVYAVGGIVRDLVLGSPNFDLDFVVEGSALTLATALEQMYPARFEIVAKHERFQTATLLFHAHVDREIDLSTARTEVYEYPAALPTVEPSNLEQDLFRRDFTINALAICLNPGRFGELVDFFHGLSDLEAGMVRVLHQFSFIEDPTRIVRAARFAARFGFELEPRTRHQAERAIESGIFDDLGGVRLRQELKLILEAPSRLKALDLLGEVGGNLRYLDTELRYDELVRRHLRLAERLLQRFQIADSWLVYLGILVSRLPLHRLDAVMERLHLALGEMQQIKHGIQLCAGLGSQGILRRSEVYGRLHGLKDQSLAIAAVLAAPGSGVRRAINVYLQELRDLKPSISGEDLLRMGVKEGPRVGEILSQLHTAKLDGDLKSSSDEREYVRKLICL